MFICWTLLCILSVYNGDSGLESNEDILQLKKPSCDLRRKRPKSLHLYLWSIFIFSGLTLPSLNLSFVFFFLISLRNYTKIQIQKYTSELFWTYLYFSVSTKVMDWKTISLNFTSEQRCRLQTDPWRSFFQGYCHTKSILKWCQVEVIPSETPYFTIKYHFSPI